MVLGGGGGGSGGMKTIQTAEFGFTLQNFNIKSGADHQM